VGRVRDHRGRVAAPAQRDLQRVHPQPAAQARAPAGRAAGRADRRGGRRPAARGRQRPLHGRHDDRDPPDAAGAVLAARRAVGGRVWGLCAESGLSDPAKPLRDYAERELGLLLYGDGRKVQRHGRATGYEGVITRFDRVHLHRDVESLDRAAREVVRETVCPACGGRRLNPAALASRIDGRNLADLGAMEVSDLIGVLARLADPVADAAVEALRRIDAIGLGYLSLDRETPTLSGGEAQRLKTVRHLGSSLTGLTYVFDEPSAGLHPRD